MRSWPGRDGVAPLEPLEVGLHRRLGTLAVTNPQRGEDRGVGVTGFPVHRYIRRLAVLDYAQELQYRSRHQRQDGIAAGARDKGVELEIGSEGGSARVEAPLALCEIRRKHGGGLLVQPARGQGGHPRLEVAARGVDFGPIDVLEPEHRLECLAYVSAPDFAHEGAAAKTVLNAHQPLELEHAQRFAHRGSADAESLGERSFIGKTIAGRDTSTEDIAPDLLHDLLKRSGPSTPQRRRGSLCPGAQR